MATYMDIPTFFSLQPGVDQNVDPGLIQKEIWHAMETDMQQMLGYALYQQIQQDIINGGYTGNPNSGNPNEFLLWYYVQPALAEFVFYRILPWINFRITNKGVLAKYSEFSKNSKMDDVESLRAIVFKYAQFLCERIIEQILNNIGQYPTYYTLVGVRRLRHSQSGYTIGGIYCNPTNVFGAFPGSTFDRRYGDPAAFRSTGLNF
jgi:hypothetical protein